MIVLNQMLLRIIEHSLNFLLHGTFSYHLPKTKKKRANVSCRTIRRPESNLIPVGNDVTIINKRRSFATRCLIDIASVGDPETAIKIILQTPSH